MAITNFPSEVFYPGNAPFSVNRNFGATAFTIDAAGEKIYLVCQAPKTGSITKICFLTSATVTGTCSVDARLETVSTTTGNPSGTLWATNTNATQGSLAANTWYAVTLTAAASVTKGQMIAIGLDYSAGTRIDIAAFDQFMMVSKVPYSAHFTASWSKGSTIPIITVEYSDGSYAYIPPAFPFSSVTAASVSSSTTPDERGNRFTLPVAVSACGIWTTWRAVGSTSDFDLVIYDNASTAVATASVDAHILGNVSGGLLMVRFASSVTLSANTTYRVVVKPTTTGAGEMTVFTVPSTAVLGALPGGANWYSTSRTDGGSWTDTNTTYDWIGIMLDGVDAGGGAAQLVGGGLVR